MATAGHVEARARLLQAIEAGERVVWLVAPPGHGKSTVLADALAEARDPRRRIARVAAPLDGPSLLAGLADRLGRPTPPGAGRPAAWRSLAEAVRLCRLQNLAVVLAIDDEQALADPADRRDLDRLAHLDPHPAARLTILRVGRPGGPDPDDAWGLAIGLPALTRSEAAAYLMAKLAAAGRPPEAFAPAAVTRLHALARGVPRGLDRLASQALAAARTRGLDPVPPDLVEAIARDWSPAL